ncbi:cation:proton antiporter [candidate division KSB1 bacterium]|nr:MAG: cation:proton antiporter [candidate division KSB1 bacterium]RKY86141.1 MAG: cation:proton antiporter [candidate division KSB1 bacterium]RKY90501.1 MAG: cation:proton antiporter [candidate division KSB1 bacterium]
MTEIIFLAIIGAGVILCLLRMLKGPTAPDRAVAVDTMATVTTALLVLLGFVFKRYVYLDVSLVYAVLTFIGSIAIARFLERGI